MEKFSPQSWMADLVNWSPRFRGRKLVNLSIPGSHDAATYTMANSAMARFAVTQQLNLVEQFNRGVRYFDIRIERCFFDKKQLQFHHGMVKSSAQAVTDEMSAFFAHIMAASEVVILKLHFSARKDYDLFLRNYIVGQIEQAIIAPADIDTNTIGQLVRENKKIVLLTKKGRGSETLNRDYESSKIGGWAKTRWMKKLASHMNKTRVNISTENFSKFKLIQTNQPAIVGLGWHGLSSVLKQDQRSSSRSTVSFFVLESLLMLLAASKFGDTAKLGVARKKVRGIISLDNVGADPDKDYLIENIIALNHDEGLDRWVREICRWNPLDSHELDRYLKALVV